MSQKDTSALMPLRERQRIERYEKAILDLAKRPFGVIRPVWVKQVIEEVRGRRPRND